MVMDSITEQWKQFLLENQSKGQLLDSISLFIDFLLAGVAIVTYQGDDVRTCCGLTPFDDKDGTNWPRRIRLAVYCYPVLLALETYPVCVHHFSVNIVNPFIGYLITFATFFDSGRTEALIIWTLEAASILAEFTSLQIEYYRLEKLHTSGSGVTDARGGGENGEGNETTEERVDENRLKRQNEKVRTMYIPMLISVLVIFAIIGVSERGGYCVTNDNWDFLGPADSTANANDTSNCGACSGKKEFCEVCLSNFTQCFIPYNM